MLTLVLARIGRKLGSPKGAKLHGFLINYMLVNFSTRLEKGKRGRSDIPVEATVLRYLGMQFSSVALNCHASVHVFRARDFSQRVKVEASE